MRAVLSLVLAAALLGVVLPRAVGTTLREVGTALTLVTAPEAVLLSAAWALGLLVYSVVLTGALPGLRTGQALTLNLTGSAVSNVLPFGGAAGTSLNYVMVRRFGFTGQQFSAFTVVTNLWGILLKLAMPAVALGALALADVPVNRPMRWTAFGAAVALALAVGVLVASLRRRSVALWAVGLAAPLVSRAATLLRRPIPTDVVARELLHFRDGVSASITHRWVRLSLGMAGYGLLQAVLLWGCLHSVGASVGVAVVLAAYAVDRVASMLVITPGASGFVEAGAAAALVTLGGAPAAMAAGVLLYRGFTFALEIPVGGIWLLLWLGARRRDRAETTRVAAARTDGLVGG